jgi:YidC/Oxa1 family membrane protein insertase
MGSSMKVMTYTMPVMSAIFCYTLPAGLGVYWIMSALVQCVQTVIIGKYFVNLDVDDIIKANIEKQNKKRAKKGLPPKKITTAATTNVKNIKTENNTNDLKSKGDVSKNISSQPSNTEGSKKGIAAKANLANKYNDRK